MRLLEKYQFVEPNHALVAEALWLLSDPDGYRNKVREVAKKDVVTNTVRHLKTEEAARIPSHISEEDENNKKKPVQGIPRPGTNFFKNSSPLGLISYLPKSNRTPSFIRITPV